MKLPSKAATWALMRFLAPYLLIGFGVGAAAALAVFFSGG